jgi:hypothetical protein
MDIGEHLRLWEISAGNMCGTSKVDVHPDVEVKNLKCDSDTDVSLLTVAYPANTKSRII